MYKNKENGVGNRNFFYTGWVFEENAVGFFFHEKFLKSSLKIHQIIWHSSIFRHNLCVFSTFSNLFHPNSLIFTPLRGNRNQRNVTILCCIHFYLSFLPIWIVFYRLHTTPYHAYTIIILKCRKGRTPFCKCRTSKSSPYITHLFILNFKIFTCGEMYENNKINK